MEKKLRKSYPAKLKFIDSASLWEALYQILSIISLKELIKLNVSINMRIKNVKNVELNTKIASAIL